MGCIFEGLDVGGLICPKGRRLGGLMMLRKRPVFFLVSYIICNA